jgi:hypothetical protein
MKNGCLPEGVAYLEFANSKGVLDGNGRDRAGQYTVNPSGRDS